MSVVSALRTAPALVLAGALLSGCGFSAQSAPLPGHGIDGDTYRLEGVFDDALNLSEGAPVKIKGVTVGQVRTVVAENYTAKVSMEIQESARVHTGARARLRGTTPLGELYVDLTDGASTQALPDGASLVSTSSAPNIEDTMTAASTFINGGGLTELGTIVRESNLILNGREDTARELLTRLDRTTADLSKAGDDIDATLIRLAGLSESLRRRQGTIHTALREVGPAARVLKSQVDDVLRLMDGVERLGHVATSVIDTIRADLLRSLRQLGPVFTTMNSLEPDLTPAIAKLVKFSRLLDRAVPTANLNQYLFFQLDASNLGLPGTSPVAAPAGPAAASAPQRPGTAVPQAPLLGPRLPALSESPKLIDQITDILKGLNP